MEPSDIYHLRAYESVLLGDRSMGVWHICFGGANTVSEAQWETICNRMLLYNESGWMPLTEHGAMWVATEYGGNAAFCPECFGPR